jgi:peptide/nickel transport system ATP-binding protein
LRTKRFLIALDGISLSIRSGETLVLLGESGSGKTTLGRLIVGLDIPNSGTITLKGERVVHVRDKGAQRGRLQMVFQDPGASLDPFMRIFDSVAEPLAKSNLTKTEVERRVIETLGLVGLDESVTATRANELSGGQKQRVVVARAIVSNPDLVVLDEPTSSIDVSIQAQILNLLIELQQLKGFTYVLITHDPNVARYMADVIAVMYLGKIVEYGPATKVFTGPKHPYTQALLSARPRLGEMKLPDPIRGEPGSLINLPKGCRYEPRCPFVMAKCKERHPESLKTEGNVMVACYLYDSA